MINMKIKYFVCLLFWISQSSAQPIINANVRKTAINELVKTIKEEYILEENIPAINSYLFNQLKSKAYDSLTNPFDFARAVTIDLRKASNDKHMGFGYSDQKEQVGDSIAIEKLREEIMRYENYGFVKADILPLNIGYVKFNDFWELKKTKNTIDAAMSFIANSDVIIIDLRDNGGGDPETVAYICSYFISEEGTVVNTLKERKNSKFIEWRVTKVSGKKMVTQPVYILTSNYTFSAAEEFAYDLQSLKRATIVGEATGGGAHPVNGYDLSNNFIARIPYAKAVNPYTKTNWEGIGVKPDIESTSQNAIVAVLKEIKVNTADFAMKTKLDLLIKTKESESNPVCIDKTVLEYYAGKYGIRTVTLDNHTLFIQRDGGPKFRLIALSETEFFYEGTETSVIFNSDAKELEITTNDGSKLKARKN